MQKKAVSFEYLNFIVDLLADRVQTDYDYIIGVGRGGLIPATMLAYKLNKKVISFGVATYTGVVRDDAFVVYQRPELLLKGGKYLVVDDICDSGNTFKIFKQIFDTEANKFEFASLFVRDSSAQYVDYYGISIANDAWLDFPWE